MRYNAKQYAKVLYDLIEEHPHHASKVVKEFAATLARHGRTNLLRGILAEFEREWYTQKGVTPVVVETEKVGAVSKAELKKLVGTDIEITEKIDPKLGAGTRITIGDMRIDNTVARRMQDLKRTVQKV